MKIDAVPQITHPSPFYQSSVPIFDFFDSMTQSSCIIFQSTNLYCRITIAHNPMFNWVKYIYCMGEQILTRHICLAFLTFHTHRLTLTLMCLQITLQTR